MNFLHKRPLVWLLLLIYCLSYFLQSWFFIDIWSVFAENPLKRTNLIAVFVDKDIYQNSKNDIERYATDYIQKRVSNSKALVLPINIQNFKAIDLVRMLENMYFDWIKWETSNLLWTILIWDIPLPVVQKKWFIYPTIFPYVDFEDQQFIYDNNQQFFVYNNNPRGQAEIWHGIINFWLDSKKYNNYFEKLKTYSKDPQNFVAPLFWYDDFVGIKDTFDKDTLPFYINNFLFTEDVGYHRFTNLMLDYFKQIQNDSAQNLVDSLANSSKDNPELAQIMKEWSFSDSNSNVPTMMLLSIIKELLKGYENLYPGVFLSAMKDNTKAAARWYKRTADWDLSEWIDSHLHKIVLKDSLSLWDPGQWMSPLMVSFNDEMEKALDKKIDEDKLYMTFPVITDYKHQNWQNKKKIKRFCDPIVDDHYKNYYFGNYAAVINSAQEFSTYRGTFRNLDSFSGVAILDTGYNSSNTKSLWSSNNLFSTQVDANRWYNLMWGASDADAYSDNKIKEKKEVSCGKWFFSRWPKFFCLTKITKDVWDKYESIEDFAIRWRGGASSLNLDSSPSNDGIKHVLKQYNYKSALFPIYDLWWSMVLETGSNFANSFLWNKEYAALIKVNDRYWKITYPKYVKPVGIDNYFDNYPNNVYVNAKDWYRMLSGTSRVWMWYDSLDYFDIINNKYNQIKGKNDWKLIIDINWIAKEEKSINVIWWKCRGKREVFSYKYKTIDSRIKNISPTPDQINGTYGSDFSEGWLFWEHYNYIKTNLSWLEENSKLSFDFSNSWLNFLLSKNKQVNSSINNFIKNNSTNSVVLLSWIQDVIINLWKEKYIDVFSGIFDSLEENSELIPQLNLWLIFNYFFIIEEIESLYNNKTIFLSAWVSDLLWSISIIKKQYDWLPTEFKKIKLVYEKIKKQNFETKALIKKKKEINKLKNCWSILLPDYCWCEGDYKSVCSNIDSTVGTLNDLNKKLLTIEKRIVVEDVDGVPTNVEDELIKTIESWLEESQTEWWFVLDMAFVEVRIKSIKKIDKEPPLEFIPGMNQWTMDRPIDWPRNITFKWLGGDVVAFVYPNLYDVSVYKKEWSNLTLKSALEIEQWIIAYLVDKSKEYNLILTEQEQKRQKYYNKNSKAFDYIANVDPLASPKNRPIKILPEDFFVSLVTKQRISELAELMYYQTLPVYSKKNEKYVDQDLDSIRTAFDLNKKISYVISWYLTSHPDQWVIVSPTYNASWYEVAYINSDREDYIAVSELPPFIREIQTAQKPINNVLIENPIFVDKGLLWETSRQCWIDSSYSEFLFDLDEKQWKWKMPWVTAIKCWWGTLASSVKFDVSMDVWPSFGEFLSWLQDSFETWRDSMKNITNPEKNPGVVFSGNLWEYWTNIIMVTWDIVSWPKVKQIFIELPTTKLLAWTQIPIWVSAQDFSGKNIKITIDPYIVYVETWYGEFISPGSSWSSWPEFNNFDRMLVYQAPNVQKPTTVTFFLTWGGTSSKQTLLVTPGNLKVSYWLSSLYDNKKVVSPLSFELTWVDSTYSSLPRVIVSLKAQDWSLLQTPFTITSKNWLFAPWIVSEGEFVPLNSYFLEKKEQAVFLMHNNRAWPDELIIEIPWLDLINIPVIINPWKPYRVDLKTNSTAYNIWETLTWSFSITDFWWNIVSWTTMLEIWSLWALDLSWNVVPVKSDSYNFSTNTKEPWGISYLYAFLKWIPVSEQSPAYKKIIVQKTFLPEENLNVMYLNLFGSDWWNLWSLNKDVSNYVPNIVSSSEKLLTVTTQSSDPSLLKKFLGVVSDHGQVSNYSTNDVTLKISSWYLISEFDNIWYVPLSITNEISLFSSENPLVSLQRYSWKSSSAIFFSKEDSSEIEITDKGCSYNWELMFDLRSGFWNDLLEIKLSDSKDQWYSVWNILYENEKIWYLYFIKPESKKTIIDDIVLYNFIAYDKAITFAEWTTNWRKWIWIIDLLWFFEKEWYDSIEDSKDYSLGIGFRSDFKNITLFGDWKSVGESTIPFGSQFLINFWDPLLGRISNNNQVSSVSMDLGIGKEIYTNPSKSILKVLETDFNNDWLKDILVVFTDWSIKLLKNYWWTHPYSNMQDIIRLADNIKDVYVWDVDGNNYPDILIWTNSDQLRVYKNDKWVIDVDWNMICLNINADRNKIQQNPESVDWLQQLFFEDMDKDWNIDIITNDLIWDIKIFYWWSKKGKANYVSTMSYACDDGWYDRQKDQVKLVKSFGVVVDPDYYIQDDSMIHVKWWVIDDESNYIEKSDSNKSIDPPKNFDISPWDYIDIWALISSVSDFTQELVYENLKDILSVSPVKYVPNYESSLDLNSIWYRSLIQLSWNNSISIYKQYKDLNWWALLIWDVVKIKTTIVWLKNNTKATYFDRIVWPWELKTDDENKIISFTKEYWNFDNIDISWFDNNDVLFVLDDINLNNRQSLSFSYEVTYKWESSVAISVSDVNFSDKKINKDDYLDIVVTPLDGCQKYRWLFLNNSSQIHRSYLEEFDNIEKKLKKLTEDWLKEWQKIFNDSIPKTNNDKVDKDCDEKCAKKAENKVKKIIDDAIQSIPSMSDIFESWSVGDFFSSSTQLDLKFNADNLNATLAPISDKLDNFLSSLCEWFKLWGKSCQPPFPFNKIPFNQAFLAPGKYHIFGCTPEGLHPLAPAFKIINEKIWGWFPLLFFPGTLQTPLGPIPMIWSSFIPIVQQDSISDWFWLNPFPPLWWLPLYASQIRMYLVPTTTLQMWVAMCFGPYKLWTSIPPLFRDLWWNCVVFAFPLYPCNEKAEPWFEDEPVAESLENFIVDSVKNGSCDQSIQYWSAKVVSNTTIVQQQTQKSPFRLSSVWSQNSSWTSAVPNTNIGFVSLSSKPIKRTKLNTNPAFVRWFNLDPFSFLQWPTIDLKIEDTNAKWIIKKLAKEWLGRQLEYMINNLTKLTVKFTLPDLSQMADGFWWLFKASSWWEAYSDSKEEDAKYANYDKESSFWQKAASIWAEQNYQALSSAANNPFESLIGIFDSIPLVELYTKDIVLKMPLPTTEDIMKYESYSRSWLNNQRKILKQWLEAIHELAYVCGKTTKEDAEKWIEYLKIEKTRIEEMSNSVEKEKLQKYWESENNFYKEIIKDPTLTDRNVVNIDDAKAILNDIGRYFQFFWKKVVALKRLNFVEWCLEWNNLDNCKPWQKSSKEDQKRELDIVNKKSKELFTCASFAWDLDQFVTFYNDALDLVRNVQQNIQVLEQYKQFPLQLYDWMHFVDKYMSDIIGFVSTLSSSLIWWVNVNARIYAKWIDSFILILTTIKTYQVIIDLSVNWSKKCGRCSRDWYWAYGCGLDFLFPKIPIIPIPPFKIPNINIDFSHVDLWINIALPRFIFVPIDFPLPQIPNLPPPPNFNLSMWLDFAVTFDYELPQIPLLPPPPTLPELPSFIPKIDFSLPLLPPAPKIPEIIPEISEIIEVAEYVAKIFCMLKKWIGLVSENWVKSKVEQLTQRTWDVKPFDFIDETLTWNSDSKLQWFDLQLDSYLQFKMDFDGFYGFLNQIAELVNSFSYSVLDAYSKPMNRINSWLNNNSITDFLNQDIKDVDLDFTVPKLDIPIDALWYNVWTIDYEVAYKQLNQELFTFKNLVEDKNIKTKIDSISSILNTPAIVSPASENIKNIYKETNDILLKKQNEIRQLAKSISSYDTFIAQVKRNDIALVNDEHIDISFSTPLFATNEDTYKLLEDKESPFKAYMDTNSSLVLWYLQSLKNSSASELSMTKSDYEKTTNYLESMNSKINNVYDKLGFEKESYSTCWTPIVSYNDTASLSEHTPLLAQSCTTCWWATPSDDWFWDDMSSYVRWIFVEDIESSKMINVVKSENFISEIGDNYFMTDMNNDKNSKDLVMRNNNSIYIKYANQKSEYKNLDIDKSFHVYSPGLFSSYYIDSYIELLQKTDRNDWYVDFWNISIKLSSQYQEVKNFRMVGQSFDAIQMSWSNSSSFGEDVDWYLIKLNHRIDTHKDKDINFRLLDDKFLNKRYVLILPDWTNYTWAKIDFKERYYYKWKDTNKAMNVLEFLSWWTYSELIFSVKSYKPTQSVISIWLHEIPRNWQYAEIIPLKNKNTLENPYYEPKWPWSNQIVAWRQILSDTIWPEAEVSLFRPATSELISIWSRHKWFVWTTYDINIDWIDNVAVANMWIEKDWEIIASKKVNSQKANIQLTWLYFTWETKLEYIIWADDVNWNKQLEKVSLEVEVPTIEMKEFIPISEFSGQLIAEISHDIDKWMVVFQRNRNDIWQEFSWTLANSYGWYFVGPKQTVVTWSVFSLGNTVWLYDLNWNEIGQITIDGQVSIIPLYQDQYDIILDLASWYPLIRILDKKSGTTVFWIQMPSISLSEIYLYQKEPFYTKIDLTQESFGAFLGWSCIQSIDKECILYVSPIGQIYLPKSSSTSLLGEYRYEKNNRSLIYVIKDFLWKDIARITTKTRLMK